MVHQILAQSQIWYTTLYFSKMPFLLLKVQIMLSLAAKDVFEMNITIWLREFSTLCFEHSGDSNEFYTQFFLATLMSPVRTKHVSVDIIKAPY